MTMLTEKQSYFVHEVAVNAANPTKAARAAGYAFPGTEGYNLMSKAHVRDAIRKRQLCRLQNGASLAIGVLEEIATDRDVAAPARVTACRTILEAANLIGKQAVVTEETDAEYADLELMTITELNAFILDGQTMLEEYKAEHNLIGHSPE